ncbi:MAG: zinc-binding alcohol dehydrogenase family protein [Candidatus Latescibacterota bacterium]|nr:zinc-binding alcohol dehydrogenase family protein [Candidatus Latescibacterota bacterium]
MQTLVLAKPGHFERTDTEEPPNPGPDQALIRISRVGICGTDLHAFEGTQPFINYPLILGHELGAEVLEVGADVEHVRAGDRVSVEPYLECGECIVCRAGRYNCCVSLQVLGVHTDGGMRERITVPARKLHPSAELSLDQLALVETMGIGAHAVARAGLCAGESVLVVGAGPIGLATAQFAALAGTLVFLMELSDQRRAFAASHFDLAGTAAPADTMEQTCAALSELCGGDLPATVFDATGSKAAMAASFHYPAAGGRLVYVGFQLESLSFSNPDFHRRELSILASRNSTGGDFQRILKLMEEGRVDTSPWITHRAGYDRIAEKFPGWLDPAGGVVKAMLDLD